MQDDLTFPQILNGIGALVSCLTPDGAVETVNRPVLEYFGKTLEELKQWTSTDAVHPDDRPGAIALWRRSVDSGQPYDMEIRQRGAMASTGGSMSKVSLFGSGRTHCPLVRSANGCR